MNGKCTNKIDCGGWMGRSTVVRINRNCAKHWGTATVERSRALVAVLEIRGLSPAVSLLRMVAKKTK